MKRKLLFKLILIFWLLGSIIGISNANYAVNLNGLWDVLKNKVEWLYFSWWGNNFWGMFLVTDIENISPGVNIYLNWNKRLNCKKQIEWYYWNSLRWWIIYPLDQQTLNYWKWVHLNYYNGLSMIWGFYTACDWDVASVYWQIKYSSSKIANYKIQAWRKYDIVTNNVIWTDFAENLQIHSDSKISWLIVDSTYWIAFLWWKDKDDPTPITPDEDPMPTPKYYPGTRLKRNACAGNCSSYISSWPYTWTDCYIHWWWDDDWKINCIQAPIFSASYAWCWTASCTDNYDASGVFLGTTYSCDTSSCHSDTPEPANPGIYTGTISIDLSTPQTTGYINKYANNSDKNIVEISINWNTKWSKNIVWWWSKWIFTNFKDASDIPSNQIDGWWKALNINYSKTINNASPKSIILSIPVKSRTPLKKDDWKILFDVWGKNYTINSIKYNFLKPYIWFLTTDPNSFIIWSQQKLILTPQKKVSLSESNLKTYNLKNWLVSDSMWYYIQYKTWENNSLWSWKSDVEFILNYTWNNVLWDARIKTDPYIAYMLGGQAVKYYLSEDTVPYSRYIKLSNGNYVWVKIIWLSQVIWKQDLTQQQKNFSNISTYKVRNKIKKNVLKYTMWMKNGEKLNEVLYLNWWNHTYSSIDKTNVKTIVIRNWNLTIDENITNWMWIILLRDNYDDKTLWNIFVKKDVTYIKWYLYGDGWLISIWDDSIWFNNYKDSYDRTKKLNKQLVLEWKLYTRNTVWWAIWTGGTYLLPWWKKTSSYKEALKYDINKFRLWNKWYATNLNQWYDNNFVIIFSNIDWIKLFE